MSTSGAETRPGSAVTRLEIAKVAKYTLEKRVSYEHTILLAVLPGEYMNS